ncbi:MAG TPA: SatD family protein [Candidatus Limnocylindrales bacterium]|nr:SatD family protein [Candidatus Limnocylindrales bacterium]
MPEKLWAVIVADVVGSSRTRGLRSVLGVRLRLVTSAHLREGRIRLPYAVTAGDEFQTLACDLRQIPELIFDLRRQMRPLQLRIGVGIGKIPGPLHGPVNQLAGQAFEFARLAISQAKAGRPHSGKATRFHSENKDFDLEANLIYNLHDALVGRLSGKQWRTVDAYLAKGRVDLAARTLRINASTASRSLSRSHLWQTLEMMESMKKIIGFSFHRLHDSVKVKRIA